VIEHPILCKHHLTLDPQVTALAQRSQVPPGIVSWIHVQMMNRKDIAFLVTMTTTFTAPPGLVLSIGGYLGPVIRILAAVLGSFHF
jgi:hypothetical protein